MKIDGNAPAYPGGNGLAPYQPGIPIRLAIAAQIASGLAVHDKRGDTPYKIADRALAIASALISAHNLAYATTGEK